MELIVFVIIWIVVSAIKAGAKSSSNSSGPAPALDDIFKEIEKATGSAKNASDSSDKELQGFLAQNGFGDNQIDDIVRRKEKHLARKSKKKKAEVAPATAELDVPSDHHHVCEDVNYDNLDVLTGGEGSFNLGSQNVLASMPNVQEAPKITLTQQDILKSFIMSEVLQKYDINRIYSRIPQIKSDD